MSHCHGSKIFWWQQTKTSHCKKWIRTASNFIDLISFHLICQILGKFSGLNQKGPYVSLEKEKQNFCVVLTYSIRWAREIAVVQQWLRNYILKNVITCKDFFFANLNLMFFFLFAVNVAKTPYCCHPEILLPWWHDVTLLLSIMSSINWVQWIYRICHTWYMNTT